jgi:predicted RNA methylase
MRTRTKTIDPETLEVLRRVAIDGNLVRITQQLDRKLYVKTNDALAALGGTWNKKVKAHVFEVDPSAAIQAAVGDGTYESVQSAEKECGFFPTPVLLAKQIVALADIRPTDRVLEPSAGRGRIADEILAACPDVDLWLCEILEGNVEALVGKGYWTSRIFRDFMQFQTSEGFDRIVMNPPFAKHADIDHVTRAYDMLRPPGRLVAIMAASFQYGGDKKSKAFRALVNNAQGIVFDNAELAFRESGTDVRTVTVILEKRPPANR